MTGTLLIISEPEGANIYINGEDTLRITPYPFTLEASIYNYTLKHSYYTDINGQVEIKEGQFYVLDATFQSELSMKLVSISALALFVSVIALVIRDRRR